MLQKLLQGLTLALALFLIVPAWAQDTGTLSGTVTDPTGAVVVGAQVTVVNVANSFQTTTVTNTEGLYRIPFLRPGTYKVSVTAAGFKGFVRDNVDLRVGATLPINASLQLGGVAESVEVNAAVPLLETETSTTGTVVEGDYFARMPLYQRHSRAVLYLTPGVNAGGLAYAGSLGGFSINGGATGNIGYFEDGMYGVQPNGSNTTDTILSTIEEVKVITTALPAEYGHSAGGAIVVVKKSGTNQLHGGGGTLFRVTKMQHRRFMQPATFEQTGNLLHFYQPDFNVSGPVYIPKVYNGKNRTFFMFAFQALMERQGEQISWNVPTPEELNGNFSYGGRSGVNAIYDPRTTVKNADGTWSRMPYAGNIIPKAQWDPVASKFLSTQLWEKPNATGTPTATGYTGNLQLPRQKTVDWRNYSVRADHQFTNRLKMFYNWSFNTRTSYTPTLDVVNLLFNSSQRTGVDAQTTSGVGFTYTVSPTMIAETRATYYRFRNDTTWPGYGTDFGALLGIPNIGVGSDPSITGIPNVNNPSLNVEENLEFKEDISKLSGKHAFKFGYDMMRLRRNNYSFDNNAGSFTLAGTNGLRSNGSSLPNTGGNSLTQFLTGAVSTYTVTTNLLSSLPRNWINSLYVQDDWKATPTLTLNIGVRWQIQSAENNKYGQISSFDPTGADNTVAGAHGLIIHPTSLYAKDKNNFQPRVGLAWTLHDNSVIRAGFSVSTVDERLPVAPSEEFGSITSRIDTPSGDYRPRFQLSQGPVASLLVVPTIRPDGTIPYASTNYSSRGATWVDPTRKSPYTMNWNFGIQHTFATYLLELSYTGNSSVNGFETRAINSISYDWANNLRLNNPAEFSKLESNSQAYRPYTNFGGINFRTNGARSNYHAGTIKLEKRFSRGLSFLTFYTYSKGIDSSSGNNLIARDLDRAESGNNRTHQFTSSMNYEIPLGKGRRWLNRGGVVDAIFGGFDMVFLYRIQSGDSLTFTYSGSPYKYMPGNVAVRANNRPNSTGDRAHLRDNWQDIGGDRFTQANQNALIESMSYFSYPDAYTFGDVGRNTFDRQRFIDCQFSASKNWTIKERATATFRFDFQNPFKWYNLSAPNTTVNFTNPATFGKLSTSTSAEGTTANAGGQGLMNITLSVRF